MHRIHRFSAIAMLLLMIGAGCSPRGLGSVTMEISLAGASALSASVDHVIVKAVNGGLVRHSPPLTLAGGAVSYSFADLPAGVWSMEATGYDAANKGIYQGKASVVVSREVSARASLTLSPADGEYEMTVDLTGLDCSQISKAEVWVYPLGVGTYAKKHVLVAPFSQVQAFTASSMKPRSYEYQIRTFDLGGAAYYSSPWYVFDVYPASRTSVSAKVDSSGFTIDLSVSALPEAPSISDFTVERLSGGMLNLKATIGIARPEDVASVTVYYRFLETDRFEEASTHAAAEMPAAVQYEKQLDEAFAAGGTAWIIAVSNGKNSLVSPASQPARFQSAP